MVNISEISYWASYYGLSYDEFLSMVLSNHNYDTELYVIAVLKTLSQCMEQDIKDLEKVSD